ncbi:unnamed protein product [Ambrosiozyma monospora]|uniref:Unnamed protein product n=1 Tax=Ambrosiozyma monospora TaxID=43982 RepID=A0A9W6YY95_AMBMO|nr:unnamed protein product [Ambrosiozyma monospora]
MVAKFTLKSRSNLFLWSMEVVTGFFFESMRAPEDDVIIEFTLDSEASSKYDDFIWAVVTKDKMNRYREENYFLSLTRTAESPKLPLEFVFMNEVPEMNDVLYHKKMRSVLEESKSFLKFIAITDLQSEKPLNVSEYKPEKKVIVELSIPKSDAERKALTGLFDFLLNDYIDYVVEKATFRPELTKKCKKTREVQLSKLKKIEEETKKEDLANKKIEEQKKLKEKMTPEELRKLEKKQKERRERRQMNKQKVRM